MIACDLCPNPAVRTIPNGPTLCLVHYNRHIEEHGLDRDYTNISSYFTIGSVLINKENQR